MMRGVEKQNSVMKTSCLLGSSKRMRARGPSSSLCSASNDLLMLLTVSKRLEFSASRRLYRRGMERGGKPRGLRCGDRRALRHRAKLRRLFCFHRRGRSDKRHADEHQRDQARAWNEVLHARFDHKFLNEDHPAFRELAADRGERRPPAFRGGRAAFRTISARELVACHLDEAPDRSATFYAEGRAEANHWFEFSAARQTMSPHLRRRGKRAAFRRGRFAFRSRSSLSRALDFSRAATQAVALNGVDRLLRRFVPSSITRT